jgi:hypothetical protein
MSEPDIQLPEQPNCLNCGARLHGQYCGQCGQRASSRLISLWELMRDAFGDLFELDSRLWRTLVPLLARPGKLTRDYLEGRRARYMPPFRMYLVLSVVFFVVAFFDPRDDLSLLFEPEPEPEPTPEQVEDADAALEEAAATIDQLEAAGTLTEEQAKAARTAIHEDDDDRDSFTLFGDGTDDGFNIRFDEETGKCVATGVDKLPEWMQRRLTPQRLEEICERVAADEGKTLFSLLLDKIPIALIVLLPVMALVLKGLYPLSRRYFVEHLLFFVHFHAFFFLILTLEILFSRVADMIFIPTPLAVLVVVAASLYVPVYLYKAMRTVYGQGHILTFIKYLALVVAYVIGASFTMMGAFLFALVSV